MSEDNSSFEIRDPDVFSRGSLKFTFDIVRKKDTQLALAVHKIISGGPLPKAPSQPDNKNSDHFRVGLDSFQVRYIVEALMEYSQQGIKGNQNPGMAIVAKTLLEDWMALAHKMIAELPDNEKP